MFEERFRIMILSKDGTGLKQISLTAKKFYLFTALISLVLITVVALSLGLFTKLYHNYRIMALEHDQTKLQAALLDMKDRVSKLGVQLGEIEAEEEKLLITAGMEPIDTDIRRLGVGGFTYHEALFSTGFYAEELSRTTAEINKDIEWLERTIQFEQSNMRAIAGRLARRANRINHWPSIKPIVGGYITDKFGFRIDPWTKRKTMHDGVDFPARRGTPVYATADGKVIVAKKIYTPNKSYGREIVIDHGDGYQTRYAHLSKLSVYKGQEVKRWQVIGEVGDTGRATGDHLHYEVVLYGKRQDPEHFIYN